MEQDEPEGCKGEDEVDSSSRVVVKNNKESLDVESGLDTRRPADSSNTAAESHHNASGHQVSLRQVVQMPLEVTTEAAVRTGREIDNIESDAVHDLENLVSQIPIPNKFRSRDDQPTMDVNLFDLLSSCLLSSTCIYCLADLREFARQGKIQSDLFMDLPLSRTKALVFYKTHLDDLKKLNGFDADFYMSAIESLANKYLAQVNNTQDPTRRSMVQDLNGPEQDEGTIVVFDDYNSKKELVYAIGVNRREKRIDVVFRGSVTARDWMVDVNPFQTLVEDPSIVQNTEKEEEEEKHDKRPASLIGVHEGFYDYLFAKVKDSDGSSTTKYQVILNHLRPLLDTHEGFYVRATGHSLGGALATLFAFFAACEDWMPKIYCVTFGSPRVGNIEFRQAFHRLEAAGKIQNLRVVNHLDPIPTMPDRLNILTAFVQKVPFRHAGIKLLLFSDKRKGHFHCAREHKSYLVQLYRDFLDGAYRMLQTLLSFLLCCLCWWYPPAMTKAIRQHSCLEYMQRIERESDDLADLSLHDVYLKTHFENFATEI